MVRRIAADPLEIRCQYNSWSGTAVFVDAPHVLKPADIASRPWLIVDEGSFQFGAEDPTLVPRAWWRYNSDRSKAIGLEETLIMLKDLLKETRCHVRLYLFYG